MTDITARPVDTAGLVYGGVHVPARLVPDTPHCFPTSAGQWAIRIEGGGVSVSFVGTPDELDEAHIRLGEAIRRIHERVREDAVERAAQDLADLDAERACTAREDTEADMEVDA